MSNCNPGTSRRGLMAAAASGLIIGAAAPAQAAPQTVALAELKKEADVACLYHCDFGEAPRFVQMLTNIANHYSAYGADPFALQLAIVAHGAGVKFFLDSFEGTSLARSAGGPGDPRAPRQPRQERPQGASLRDHLRADEARQGQGPQGRFHRICALGSRPQSPRSRPRASPI
ncbi:DsrE family protein [Bosea thiooxidans]